MTAKTTSERQREFRQRKADTPEVRGLMFSYSMNFPGFGFVMAYSVA